MKIPDIRYRSSQIFGDTNWHRVLDLSQMGLSEFNPNILVVGQAELPLSISSATKIKSVWLWRYGFVSANSTNYWSTSTGSNGSTSPSNWGVNVSTSPYYTVVEGNTVSDGYVTSGSNGKTAIKLESIRFSSANDWYFSPSVPSVPTNAYRAIVCRFLAAYEADLPSDMYTISGRNITWNQDHPVYTLLVGKEVIPY